MCPGKMFHSKFFILKLKLFLVRDEKEPKNFSQAEKRRRKTKFSSRNISLLDELFLCYDNYCSFWILRKLFQFYCLSNFFGGKLLMFFFFYFTNFQFFELFFWLCVELKT